MSVNDSTCFWFVTGEWKSDGGIQCVPCLLSHYSTNCWDKDIVKSSCWFVPLKIMDYYQNTLNSCSLKWDSNPPENNNLVDGKMRCIPWFIFVCFFYSKFSEKLYTVVTSCSEVPAYWYCWNQKKGSRSLIR